MIDLLISFDESSGFGFIGYHSNLFFSGIVLVILDILSKREIEEHWFLANNTEFAS